MAVTLTGIARELTDGCGFVKKADMRRQPRVSARGMVTVAWRDESRQIRYMRSLVRNLSGGGALVLSYRALPVGAFVRIRATNLYFSCWLWTRAALYSLGLRLPDRTEIRQRDSRPFLSEAYHSGGGMTHATRQDPSVDRAWRARKPESSRYRQARVQCPQAYSLDFAAVPQGPLGYLTAWPRSTRSHSSQR